MTQLLRRAGVGSRTQLMALLLAEDTRTDG